MAHPDRTDLIPKRALARARKLCLALPDATEKTAWGSPTFRVRNKIFASIGTYEEDERVTVMNMKAAAGEQESLLAEGHPFFRPAYVGRRGWVGVIIDARTDWSEITELVEDSYREVAPKKLIAQLDG